MQLFYLIKKYFGEGVIIFALVFSINNYFGNESLVIKADGTGYYDYLPSIFIYGDLPKAKENNVSERIQKMGVYVSYKGHKLNKYPCGTAVLLFPFFIYAHLTSTFQGFIADGFSLPYQRAVFYGALFYLFFSLIFLKRLLRLYNTPGTIIFFIQVLVVFSTSIINYVNYDPSFSHVYSFFAITTFLYFVKAYFINKKQNDFLWACVFLSLIIILRQVNVIIVLFIPFLAGSFSELKASFVDLFKNKYLLLKAFFLIFGIVSIQLYFWFQQTGEFIVFSYQGESFNFLDPAFIDILFSYKKGLFVYTPVFFVAMFALFFYIKRKQIYLFVSWLSFFLLLTYVLSSWWCWYYGCSYGLRAYIDFYAIFCILLATILDSQKKLLKWFIVIVLLVTIPINMIQTLQYKRNILHWTSMDKKKYWFVFLKTSRAYEGLVNSEGLFSENEPLHLIKIKTSKNKFVSSIRDEASSIVADRDVGLAWETFNIIILSPTKIALKSDEGSYVSVRPDEGGILKHSAKEIKEWETFTMISFGKDTILLKAFNNKYIKLNGIKLFASADSLNEGDRFTIIKL